MKLSYLWRGTPGHPIHPPLTDVTIGIYTLAALAGILGILGVTEENMAKAWWLALVFGLATTGLTALTGFFDWLTITRGTPLWRTATVHALANLAATAFFLLAAIFGHDRYVEGDVGAGSLGLTLVGYALLTLGGWLGGTIVFGHGMRVLNLPDEPSARAVSPAPEPEEEAAERG